MSASSSTSRIFLIQSLPGIPSGGGAPVSHEVVEEPELGAGQAERCAIDVEDALRHVQPQRTDLEDLGKLRIAGEVGAAHMRAQARDELPVAKRLDDVVIRADIEGPDLVLFFAQSGEDDDRQRRAALPELTDELEAVPRIEIEIDDRDRRALLLEDLERARGIVCDETREAGLLDQGCEQIDEIAIVIDDKNLGPGPSDARTHHLSRAVAEHTGEKGGRTWLYRRAGNQAQSGASIRSHRL